MIVSSDQDKQLERTIAIAGDDEHDRVLAWEWRVFAVSLVGLIPGIQLGCILGVLFVTTGLEFYGVAGFGGILGMIAAGKLEAHDGS